MRSGMSTDNGPILHRALDHRRRFCSLIQMGETMDTKDDEAKQARIDPVEVLGKGYLYYVGDGDHI